MFGGLLVRIYHRLSDASEQYAYAWRQNQRSAWSDFRAFTHTHTYTMQQQQGYRRREFFFFLCCEEYFQFLSFVPIFCLQTFRCLAASHFQYTLQIWCLIFSFLFLPIRNMRRPKCRANDTRRLRTEQLAMRRLSSEQAQAYARNKCRLPRRMPTPSSEWSEL